MKCIRAKSNSFNRPTVVRFNKSHEHEALELVKAGVAVFIPKHCCKRFERDVAKQEHQAQVRKNFSAPKDAGKLYRRLKRNTKGAI